MGAKKRPFYRIVIADSRSPRDGRAIDTLGYYDPIAQPAQIKVDRARADEWIRKGAQPTDRVKILLERAAKAPAVPEPVTPEPQPEPEAKAAPRTSRTRAPKAAAVPEEGAVEAATPGESPEVAPDAEAPSEG
jgi:small subunit ribosomal protein S16